MGLYGRLTAALLVLTGMTAPAFAYLDPGTGSLILQTLVGGIAALILFGKTAWYKVKTFFSGEPESVDNQDDAESQGPDA